MLRFLFLFFIFPLLCIPAFKILAISPAESQDTCFYSIIVPPDIDFPETPYFDTTIQRSKTCKIHVLKLPSWGTETEYTMSRKDSIASPFKKITMEHDKGFGLIDITDFPSGTYEMRLKACGNGGSFTIRIK